MPIVIMQKGISTLIGTVFVVLISVVSISVVLTIGLPAIETAEESFSINQAQDLMILFDNTIKQTASEGTGVSKKLNVNIREGTFRIDNVANALSYTVILENDLLPESNFTDGIIEKNISLTMSEKHLEMKIKYERIILNGDIKTSKGPNAICFEKTGSDQTNVFLNITEC